MVNGLRAAGLPTLPHRYVGWVGVETRGEEEAVWLLRAVLVEHMLARREESVLYLPVGATRVQNERRGWPGLSNAPGTYGRPRRRTARRGDVRPSEMS